MKRSLFLSIVLLLSSLTGCGGGGGGGTSTIAVSGVASKGPFISGTVNLYDVSGGLSAKRRINTGGINSNGEYSIPIPPTSTPVMLEIAAGAVYKDETKSLNVPSQQTSVLDAPMRALIPSAASTTSVMITPFTEIAVQKAVLDDPSLSQSTITRANTLVAEIYRLPDIIQTKPIDFSQTIGTSDPNRINYGIALAAVSQLAPGSVSTALQTLAVTSLNISPGAATSFKNAVSDFLGSPNNPNTSYVSISNTSFTAVGSPVATSAVVEVGLKSSYSNVYSFAFRVVTLPSGSVTGDPTVEPINTMAGQVRSVGTGANNDTTFTVSYAKNVTSSPGFTITADVPVMRLTYSIASGQSPQFALSLEDVNSHLTPLLLTSPSDPSVGIAPNPALTASDYFLSVTYKDANGNAIQ